MRVLGLLLILIGVCNGQDRYINSVIGVDGRAEVKDEAGGANIVYVIGDGSSVVGVHDSGLARYEEVSKAGNLSAWVALNVDGEADTIEVDGAKSFIVAEYGQVKSVRGFSGSGEGFEAQMVLSTDVASGLSWALDVYSAFSWPFRGPEVRASALNNKFILGDNAINAGRVDLRVPITSTSVGGGLYDMIILELQ